MVSKSEVYKMFEKEKHMVTGKMFYVIRNYGEKQPVIVTDGQVIINVADMPVMRKADKAR
jgi:hypothetical protein